MAIRTLLAFSDTADDIPERVALTAGLAEALEAHLTVLAVTLYPPFRSGYHSVAASEAYLGEVQRSLDVAAALADRWRDALTGRSCPSDVRWASDTPGGLSDIAALEGHYAELTVVGRSVAGDQDHLRAALLKGLLFGSGRPVMVVPPGWSVPPGRRIVVGWTPCRAAARAVGDAMALIDRAEAVSVAVVDPRADGQGHGAEPGAAIAAVLARHQVPVTVYQLPASDRGVAAALSAHAADFGADLIVMGGYGHARLIETLLGGVTHDMLEMTRIPLLLSH